MVKMRGIYDGDWVTPIFKCANCKTELDPPCSFRINNKLFCNIKCFRSYLKKTRPNRKW